MDIVGFTVPILPMQPLLRSNGSCPNQSNRGFVECELYIVFAC